MIKKIVKNPNEGLRIAKALLYKHTDKKTVLFLSGGTMPKLLYETLVKEKRHNPGAVALVDERYGLPFHLDSNEKMIRDTGLLSYLSQGNIPFYRILQEHFCHSGKLSESEMHPESLARGDSGLTSFARMTLKQAAKDYNAKVKFILGHFPKRIAIMGIGEDGHTAGLPASPKLQRGEPAKVKSQKSKVKSYVREINNFPGEFKKRITLTFNALSEMDLLIVLVFGSTKQKALDLMFTKGSEEEIPARFYTQPEIAGRTILITDQKV